MNERSVYTIRTVTTDEEALRVALLLIENYQADVRDRCPPGTCEGSLYRDLLAKLAAYRDAQDGRLGPSYFVVPKEPGRG